MEKKYPPWQQTYSNEIVEIQNPKLDSLKIEDIAHALSMQCRFAGHVPKFYSVAEHSFFVSFKVPKQFALWGLMHDAAEAYITDIPTYVKRCVPDIRHVEQYLLGCIALQFLLCSLSVPPEVKEVDLRMLMTEKEQFYTKHVRDWEIDAEPYNDVDLLCWSPHIAEGMFLARFHELSDHRD